jgi:hypothetical protein
MKLHGKPSSQLPKYGVAKAEVQGATGVWIVRRDIFGLRQAGLLLQEWL